jgi:DNA modification methylase
MLPLPETPVSRRGDRF